MVYSHKFVAVVVCKGQIVRELREDSDDVIRLPFGADYSIRLKNLHSERAIVSIEIDGQDVLDGTQIVVDANETADIEGFMKGHTVRNKFRFIEKTQQISKHRGDYIEDGIIQVSYQFEKPKPPVRPYHWHRSWGKRYGGRRRGDGIILNDTFDNSPIIGSSMDDSYGAGACASQNVMRSCFNDDTLSAPDSFTKKGLASEDGITVAGADTHQHFNTTYVGALETQSHSIVIRILGQTKEGKKFTRPKITRRKVQCPTCGNRNNSRVKYCPTCGTNVSDVV